MNRKYIFSFLIDTGNFYCEISNGCGTIQSQEIELVIGIESYSINDKIKIYPNPTSHQLIIESEELLFKKIDIINVTGKTIKSIKQNINIINVTDLSNGIYFIKVFTEEKTITKKFVKQ